MLKMHKIEMLFCPLLFCIPTQECCIIIIIAKMSSIENVVVDAVEVKVKVVKVKKPSLPVKLQKFASSIYFILQTLNAQDLISDEAIETAITQQFHLFDPLDNLDQQTVVLQALLDQQPAALKSFRKVAITRNKPPKAPKAKAVKEPKAPKEKVPKAPRAKKVKATEPIVEPAIELVNEVIRPVVLSEPEPASTEVIASTETKPKKVRKTKKSEVAVEVPVVDAAPTEEAPPAVKAKKEKAVKEPKVPKEKAPKKTTTKNTPKVTSDASDDLIGQIVAAARSTSTEQEQSQSQSQTQEEEEDDEDDVIQTREFSFEGTLYLIDQDNQLYSSSTHDHIGAFEPVSNSIVLL